MLHKFFQKYRYGLSIFFILVIFLISKSLHSLDEDIIISYVIDYKTGFGPRKLMASILSMLFGVPTMGQIRAFAFTISTIACLLFSWLCNTFLAKMKDTNTESFISVLYLIALYLICPASLLFLLQYPNVGRLDIVLYCLCLLFCVLFYYRNNNRVLYYCGTTILLIIGILTHHIFVATYMTFMVALFVYDIWETSFNKKRFLAYLAVGIISSTTLASMLIFSSMNMPLDDATHYNPHFELSRKFVCFGYYAHIFDHFEQYFLPKWHRLAAGFTLTTIFLAPLFLAFCKIWKDLISTLNDKRQGRLLVCMHCSFLLFIPAFCITVDYLRWFGAFIFLQILLLSYFSYDTNNKYNNIRIVIFKNLKQHLFFATFLLIYLAAFKYFTSDTYFDIVEFIMEKLHIQRVSTLLPPEYRIN